MDFIKPTNITDALFVASDVPEDEYDEWIGGTGVFAALGQTSRSWKALAVAPVGSGPRLSVYACVPDGDIYKQTDGTGDFVALSQTSRTWAGLAVHVAGHAYASVTATGGPAPVAGDIYKQTDGTGDFVALSQTSRAYTGMTSSRAGHVYVCVNNGDIYKQTDGTGDFVALSQTSRGWYCMGAAYNGDIYAAVFPSGDIYKQTNGAGDFVALGQTLRAWTGIAGAPNGDVYACAYNGDIYRQAGGVGDFVALGQTSRYWMALAASANHNIYSCVTSGDIYKSTPAAVYSQEDQVIRNHVVYESLTNNNTNNDPATDTTNWLELGATNHWACFDGTIGNQTEQANSLTYVLAPGAIDSVALMNIESTSVDIIEIDLDDDLVTNGEAWTGATGTTQPNNWDKVATPTNFTIDGGAIRITVDAANEGISQTIAVTAAKEYQLLGKYKNTAGDIAQIAIYDVTNSANILATTDLASSTVESVFSHVFTTPAGCVSLKISLLAKAAGDIVWFDDVRLAPTEYSETVTTGTSKTDLVKLDIPQKAAGILTVKVNHSTGTAKLGELIVGAKTNIGTMRYSPSIGITDYSTKQVDIYGHYSIVARSFAKRMTCSLIILNSAIDEVIRLLTLYRSTELVWVGDENYNSLIVYGFYKDFQVVFSRPQSSDCALEIEGLT